MPDPTWAPFNQADPLQTFKWAFQELEARTNQLRNNALAGGFPPNPVEGMIFVEVGPPARPWFYGRLDVGEAQPSWHPLWGRLLDPINGDPDPADGRVAPMEHFALRLENVAGLSAPVASNRGLMELLAGTGEVYYSGGAEGTKAFLSILKDASLDAVEQQIDSDFGNDAVNPPTRKAKGTIEGWLFDAVAEKRTFVVRVPKNYDGLGHLKFRLWQLLDAAEDAGDDIEWSGEFRALVGAGGKAGQAASALVDVATDIGADAEGIADGGGPHLSVLDLPMDVPNNEIAAGTLLAVTVWRKTVGGAGKVSGVVVVGTDLAYPQRPRMERA